MGVIRSSREEGHAVSLFASPEPLMHSMLHFVSPSSFARQVGINRKTILQAIRSRQLPAVMIGQRYRIEVGAAEAWARGQFVMLNQSTMASEPPSRQQ